MSVRMGALFLSAFTCAAAAGVVGDGDITQQSLWKSGNGGYHTYRIPALVKTTKGTLLAFAEGRKDSSADHGDIDIVLRRSEDNGRSWSKMQVIQDDGKHIIGNPCPLVDRETGRIFLLSNGSQHNEGDIIIRGKGSREIYISHSDDDGKTWSERRNISAMVKKPDWRWYATGPCSGIQIQSGKYKGRLAVPANHSYHGAELKKWEFRCHSLYSDDRGETWEIGQSSAVGASETQIAEASEDLLIQDIRMQTHRKGVRAVRFSKDGGATWSPLEHDTSRKDPRCQGSVIRHGDVLISSNPNSDKRENMTVYVSKDQGQSWKEVAAIYTGPSAYSDLAVLPDGTVACLYERGDKSPYEQIVLATFTLQDLHTANEAVNPSMELTLDEKLEHYVAHFNAVDEEEGVNDIHNKDVIGFMTDNIPLFECPDEDFERTYYFRWWTYRKHLRNTEDGWVVTEFYPDVSWAKKHNKGKGLTVLADGRRIAQASTLSRVTGTWMEQLQE